MDVGLFRDILMKLLYSARRRFHAASTEFYLRYLRYYNPDEFYAQ